MTTPAVPYTGVRNPFITGLQDEEDAQHFFITEDEVYSASDDIDLVSLADQCDAAAGSGETLSPGTGSSGGSAGGNTMMDELEMTTSNLVSSATISPGDDATFGGRSIGRGSTRNLGNESDDEDDIGDDYGVHIDEEIVDDILGSSEDRFREQSNQVIKKYCMYGMVVFGVFLIFVAMLDTEMLVWNDIQNQGSAYHYDDREASRNGGKEHSDVLNEHITYNDEDYRPYFTYAARVTGPKFNPTLEEIPFFFRMPSVSSTVEDTFSRCLGLVIASDKPGPPGLPREELLMYDYDETGIRKYLNVDLSTVEGIKRAAALNLASSELAEVLVSPYLHFPLDALFSPEITARLFTVVRHPIDWAISAYYDFTQNAVEGVLQTMTLEEFIESNYYAGNQLTRVLWHGYGPEIPNENHLHLAQELLRTKFVIGLHEKLAESITLFEDYFYWEHGNNTASVSCKRELRKVENKRELDMYREIGDVRAGSAVHKRIVEQNSLDLQLYWYAVDLHKAQRASIPTREKAQERE